MYLLGVLCLYYVCSSCIMSTLPINKCDDYDDMRCAVPLNVCCILLFILLDQRVTANLENLEYSGISMEMENLGYSRGILCNLSKIFYKQNSFSSIRYLRNTTRSWASDEQSLLNFRDGYSALVTFYNAGVEAK